MAPESFELDIDESIPEDQLDAFVRVGVVAHEVAETNEMGALLLLRILENGLGRLEVGVQVTENGEAHGGN